jgi:hypothetical protein
MSLSRVPRPRDLLRRRIGWSAVALLLTLCGGVVSPHQLRAQEPEERRDDRPAFSLSSGEIFTTKASPHVQLTFERLSSLDFRVYRVDDHFAFFAGLKDPHMMGSEAYVVPTEQTWLERLSTWKADRRADLQTFLRRQTTREYRAARRAKRPPCSGASNSACRPSRRCRCSTTSRSSRRGARCSLASRMPTSGAFRSR